MISSPRVKSLALTLLALLAACAAAPAPPKRVDVAPSDPGASAVVSPARWGFHPAAPSVALAAVKLDDGGCVLTAEGGQRWSSAATKQAGGRLVCAGKAEASAAVAGEDLTTAIRRADGAWIFVGATGALFEAKDPLGPFTRTVPAPEPLARVTGAGAGVLAATQDGRLLRWDEARGWRAAVSSGPLPGARVFDVIAGEGGRALALAFPEQLFMSDDGGATWTASGAPRVGARSLGRAASGELGALGLFESLVWRGRGSPPFARGTEKIQAQQAALDVEVGRAPSAIAVRTGRAVIDVDRYYEVIRPESEGGAWQLARGRIDGRLEVSTLPDSDGCGNLRLGARGKVIYLVCVAQEGGEIRAAVRRSADRGATWAASVKLATLDTDQIHVAVAPDGGALIVGACRVEAGSVCRPGAPVRIKAEITAADGGARPPLAAVIADAAQLTGAALLPAFSFDGRSAYFLGRRGKDDRIHLFVSHDGGDSFSPRVLDTQGAPRVARRMREDDDEPAEPEQPDTFEVDEESSLRPGDDGSVGMMLLRSRTGEAAYVLADDDGHVLQISGLPVEGNGADDDNRGPGVIMSGHGRRVLAVALTMIEGSPLPPVWESLDGGATWDRQSGPYALVREYERGVVTLACALGGCLVGDNVTRLGWGGQGEPGLPEPAAQAPAPDAPGVRTPIVCELSKTPWARVEHAYGGLSYGVPMPGIHESMRGRAVWSTLTVDHKTGAIGSVSAILPESGEGEARIVTRRLLGPRPAGGRVATALSASQHEGFAALRVPFAVDAKGAVARGGSMRGVEVAWENFFEGTSGRARIADAGPLDPADIALGNEHRGDGALVGDVLLASLVSISSRGIFVHPHHKPHGPPAFFIDPAGRATRYEPHAWATSSPVSGAVELRADASALDGELLGVGLLRDGDEWGTVALAKKSGAGTATTTAVSALSLLPPRVHTPSLAAYTTWSWAAKAPVGLVAFLADPARRKAWGHVVGFRGDGTFLPAEPVPTLFDLADPPRGCAASDRAVTARLNVPFVVEGRAMYPGARHPVLVREPRTKGTLPVDDAAVLLTAGAVLHGTPAKPCVAAFEAPAVGKAPIAAILPGDLARSWLFRFSVEAPKSAARRPEGAEPVATLEHRAMTCRYDPSARVPDSVHHEPGAARP